MRKLIGVLFFLIGLGTLSFVSRQEFKPIEENTPSYFHHYPKKLSSFWSDTAISVSQFSEEEVNYQKKLNEKEEHILSYSPTDSKKEWTSIDYEEITPYTWKWIILECRKPNGSLSKIKLRRPNKWIKAQEADKIGVTIQLDLLEMGIVGEAKITDIIPNQLDTRFWNEGKKGDYLYRPITGFFEHESSEIWHLYFENNLEPLGVTSSHPIWSIDKNNWVSAENLKVGEKVKTKEGITVLQSKEKQEGLQKVYNLEIYKDHNFHVAEEGILVHNTCWQERIKAFMSYAENIDPKTLKSQDETIKHLENVFTALDKTKTDDRVLRLVGETNVVVRDGVKTI